MRCARALVIVALLAGVASAQQWQPPDPMADFEAERARMMAEHEERVHKMDEDFERSKKQMDSDFSLTTRYVFAGFIGFVALILIVSGGEARRKRRLQQLQLATPVEYAPLVQTEYGGFDVCTLRIAVDGRASKFVQTELAAIVKQYDRTQPETRARCLRETSIMLRRVRDSWLYVGADNEPMRPQQETLAAYQKLVDDARTRVTQSRGTSQATRSGDSVILVSIIVATRGELMTITDLATGEDLRRALESSVDRAAADVIALDVIWEPTEEGRTLSSAVLEAAYRTSELHRLAGSNAGKAFCTYCGGPFPIELVTCPHCGAPARESRRAS